MRLNRVSIKVEEDHQLPNGYVIQAKRPNTKRFLILRDKTQALKQVPTLPSGTSMIAGLRGKTATYCYPRLK